MTAHRHFELIKKTSRKYVWGLILLAILLAFKLLWFQLSIETQRKDANTINLAGRQRMLSQKGAKLCLLISKNGGTAEQQKELRDLIRLIDQVHHGLRRGDESLGLQANDHEEVEEALKALDPLLENYLTVLQKLVETGSLDDQALIHAETAFLHKMDFLVGLFSEIALDKVNWLSRVQWLLTLLLWISLALEALFIFQPMNRQIKTVVLQLLDQETLLKKQNADLSKASEAKSRFLANMSHEIRTPLNAIVGFGKLARESEGKLPPDITEYLRHIDAAGKLLKEVIGNILDLSKIESGKMDPDIANLDIHALVKGIYHVNKSLAHEKNIDFTYSIGSAVPQWIQSDRTFLNQICMNLVSNATKFTESGKRVNLNLECDGEHVLIVVEDEGIGMNEEQLQRVFAPFEQADSSTKRKFGGTGLGLSIIKNMAELLNGEVQVESQPERGTSFTVSLPLIRGENKESPSLKINYQKNLSLLIVDDSRTNLALMAGVSKKLGLLPQVAQSAEEGLKLLSAAKPDLLVLDLHMPNMDGFEMYQAIPPSQRPCTFMLSADVFDDTRQQCQEEGIQEFLGKPIDIDQFISALVKHFPIESDSESQADESLPENLEDFLGLLKDLREIPFLKKEDLGDRIEDLRAMVSPSSNWSAQLDTLEKLSLGKKNEAFILALDQLESQLS